MPPTCQSLRESGILMVFGFIRTMMMAALAFSTWNSVPSRSLRFSGSALTSWPISMSIGLDRLVGDVVDQPDALLPDGRLDRRRATLLGRPRPEVGQTDDHRQEHGAERADQAAADHLAAGDLRLVDDLVQLGQDVFDVLRAGLGAVPVVDHLVVVHQLPGPLHRTHADEQQRQAEGQAEQQVAGVGVQEAEVHVHAARDGEVGHHEADRPAPAPGRNTSPPAGWPGRPPPRRRRSAGAGARGDPGPRPPVRRRR